jgi:hypothetical protein
MKRGLSRASKRGRKPNEGMFRVDRDDAKILCAIQNDVPIKHAKYFSLEGYPYDDSCPTPPYPYITRKLAVRCGFLAYEHVSDSMPSSE